MTRVATGRVHGNTITLDEPVPPLEGMRVRVVLETVEESEIDLSAEERSRLWSAWRETGPQGPIESEGDDRFGDER